ncbi:SAM-dependent methyltransferase [Ureibacillus massiliensis 4400831 = CIP 108448 = CCUG 49529]|uniref:SAM-dependent methyltransferase n=1 Tax=Ureibacillus massiliensis 4400831 = CIP 108448 = CCUG 49529 TaxID=1211035 RepID=A0A0A3J0W4_9BACL|nr:tRNA (adenine(22)-N(1))-methyltransferase TrmK [Ureibacillus massiliensis]KGR90669.1 SAM-dependent methyltransferase [Ureibacillus massiliensis 4400831 = CIP 108448 = CCUG 49529]
MNAEKLSKRLETVASFVPTGAIIADIGSDHAYLPCYLINKKIAKKAIAGEVVKGPFESAVRQVREAGLMHKISVRLADGLDAIDESDKVDTITIAGMGGPLIVSILDKKPAVLQNVTRLILQPNIHAKVIRQWGLDNGWAILDEVILEEDEKIYEVIVLQRGEMTLTEEEILLGKYLLNEKSETFIKKWTKEVENWKRVLESIEQAESSSSIIAKRGELLHLIALVEGIIENEKA